MNRPIQSHPSLGTVQTGSTPSSGHATNWPVFSLGNVCSVRRGTTITQTQANPGEIPIVAGGLAATYFHNTPNRKSNVITVSASGASAGFVNYWETPIFASDCSTVESESPDVSIKYVFHFLRGKQEYIYSKLRSGAAQPHVYAKDISALKILLPPLPEQRRIAAILDQADALRAKRREAFAQLDSLTQSIFIEMFGGAQTIFNKWSTKKLGEILDFLTSGSRGWAEYYTDSGALFLRVQNVCKDELKLDDVAFVNAPDSTEAKRTKVQEGDVLLSITADLGRTAVIPAGLGEAHINQHLSILRTSNVIPRYLSAFLTSPAGQREILGRDKHGVKAGLNFDDIRSFRVPMPPEALQHEFVQRANLVLKQKLMQQQSLVEIETLFASLQHRAFRGEL